MPTSVGEALDLHAKRLGADPQTLRLMLAPLALAEADSIPVHLWARLASAVAGQDMGQAIAGGMLLAGPFVQPEEQEGEADAPEGSVRTLLRLLHPAIGDEIRAGLPNVRAAQTQIAMALLEAVPEQDWSKADPYVRDHIAGHTLEAGLLPHPEGPATPVAVLVVPADTPGARPVDEAGDAGEASAAGRSAVLVHGLVRPEDLGETDPGQILRPSEDERAAAPLGLSRGADYLLVWDRASEEVVAALISDTLFTAAGLSPDGILLVATERGAKALRIRPEPPAIVS